MTMKSTFVVILLFPAFAFASDFASSACNDSRWQKYDNMFTTGGTFINITVYNATSHVTLCNQTDLETIENCRYICTSYTWCQAIDWNNNSNTCWLSPVLGIPQPMTNITHYIYVPVTVTPIAGPATPSGACYWSETQNTNAPNGLSQPKISTLDACKTACLNFQIFGDNGNIYSCTGIDWDSRSGNYKCYFSTSNVTTGNADGITHYTYTCLQRNESSGLVVAGTTTLLLSLVVLWRNIQREKDH